MKIDANSIRIGDVLEYDKKLWVVSKTMHTQPGKGGAYMQVEMKEIINGTKLNNRFRSTETVEKVRLEQKLYQYLYDDGEDIVLMEQETYTQISMNKAILGEAALFLQSNMEIDVSFYEDKPISATLPETVVAMVAECEPVLKGQTATASYKPAILDNGVRIMVPPFVNVGDKVVIKTATCEYLERAKD